MTADGIAPNKAVKAATPILSTSRAFQAAVSDETDEDMAGQKDALQAVCEGNHLTLVTNADASGMLVDYSDSDS